MAEPQGMSVITRSVTRWLLGLIFVFGLAVTVFEHMGPGGGFVGGAALGCGAILSTLALGGRAAPASALARAAPGLLALGGLGFLVVAVLGYTRGRFIQRWIALGEPGTITSTPFVLLMNLAVCLLVASGIFAGFLALTRFEGDAGPEEGGRP